MKKIIFALLFACTALMADVVQRDRTVLRTGPGAWYPALVELSKGANVKVINKGDRWIEVSSGKDRGFIAAKSLETKANSKNNDIFAQMGMQTTSVSVSQSAVSASIKGFAERFSKRLESDLNTIQHIEEMGFDNKTYALFKKNTIKNKELKKLRRVIHMPRAKKNHSFTFQEEGSGLAVAAKLGSMGLYRNAFLEEYVNLVGTFVAEQSQGYDINFRFLILDQDGVNGYACPGGIIFITRGALEMMRSEAELACFLGHEISHVVYRHGMKEMEERKEMIIADGAFEEMSRTVGESEKIAKVSEELDDIALASYETIFEGRLGDYEEEADEMGLLYAVRSGYDPHAMATLLNRMGTGHSMTNSEHYSPAQNKLRISRLNKYLKQKRWKSKHYRLHGERFSKMAKRL